MGKVSLLNFVVKRDTNIYIKYRYPESLIHVVLKAYIAWYLRMVKRALSVETECNIWWFGRADVCAHMLNDERVLVEIAVSDKSIDDLAKKISSLSNLNLEQGEKCRILVVIPERYRRKFKSVPNHQNIEVDIRSIESLIDELILALKGDIAPRYTNCLELILKEGKS